MSKIDLHPRASEFLSQKPIPAFIGGRWMAGSAGAADVIDPATGAAIGQVSMAGTTDVNTAVEAAHQAFAKWSSLNVNERSALLHRLADKITEQSEILAQLEAIDVGKPVVNARGFDVPFGADCIRYFADLSKQTTYDVPLAIKGMDARIHRAPYGVCGFIFPWNFPFTLLCWGIGPALAAGNTVVVKDIEDYH